ncbi:hypothetical protein [Labilithrix luteola]|uniref:hypothetical protein n=1 Tax=Labilithrix luteola TaxID=1391654 RepID=UPI0011BAD597|nr:hypothetical protein [Labilithrix luteola]
MRKASPAALFVLLGIVACTTTPKPPAQMPPGVDATADAGVDASSDETATAAEAPDEDEAADAGSEAPTPRACPDHMALVDDGQKRFCIDQWEASLVETVADGSEQPYPHYLPVDGHVVRAVSEPGVFPQGFISEVQAQDACAASGKRLCAYDEWKTACMGPAKTTFPYGDARRPGTCHDTGKSAVGAVFGTKALAASPAPAAPAKNSRAPSPASRAAHVTSGRAAQTSHARATPSKKASTAKGAARTTSKPPTGKASTPKKPPRRPAKASTRPASVDPSVWTRLNDPALGQVEGALAQTGDHAECRNAFDVYDMVGNLHEWVATDASLPHGTFAGGYYLDTTINGDGCRYRTVAHAHEYHDYSTGFRCCATPRDP